MKDAKTTGDAKATKVETKPEPVIVKNLNGFAIDKPCGTFNFIFPIPANIKDCYDACVDAINKIVEIAKQEEEKIKKEQEAKKPTEEITPEIVNNK